MKIHVDTPNIKRACRRDSHHCMIADAIAEQIPDARFILVDLQTIRWSEGGTRYVYLTPPEAQQAILAFDQGVQKIAPFSMNLKDPRIKNTRGGRKTRSWASRKKAYPDLSRPGARLRTGKVAYKHREFGLRTFKK